MQVWSASTGAKLQQLIGHSDWVKSVAFSHDGTCIVSGSDDKSVHMWSASTDLKLQQLDDQIASGSDVASIWIKSRMHWTSTMDGWIVSLPGKDHLVWLPQGIREVIHHPYNTLVISQEGYAHINFQDCNIGIKWAECYKPLFV